MIIMAVRKSVLFVIVAFFLVSVSAKANHILKEDLQKAENNVQKTKTEHIDEGVEFFYKL